ncbi:Tyrosine-tRNA ligase, mitochondrial [Daldinia childiae]|uniref:Tyrosine-tRNA ligase, mitochondrial n=1 Tax=Daldinia childiae TaxID=326645 RepID=UPI0014468C60|nr:Tyrosine-tRNA ligase, mitochondrial [Daldinia childiae]KAF3057310.1 Tyrosine-tRNA ligase, mitochondrial [Daldinia childiae]
MLSSAALPAVRGSPLNLCRRCLLKSLAARGQQTRSISTSFLEKQAEAKKIWDERAQLIKEGKIPHLWDMFKERGYVKDIAGTDEQIRELMRVKRIGAYVGIDPTAPSLHVGHLLPLMPLFWMYIHGYRAVSLVGGATVKVGDPTGRLQSRDPISKSDITMNITKIHYQLKRIWANVEAQGDRFGYKKQPRIWSRALVNNSMWYNNVPFIEVVARLFKGIRIGPMLSRETVKRKMEQGDGMSLDEFVYPLMQGWDWWHLYNKQGVQMQIGGSDQYGNIISGIDAVKHIRDNEPNPAEKIPNDFLHMPVGFTVPLLTDSSGVKFGKSAGNAVWLDQFMTSIFDLYGYFIRRPDADVEGLLKQFTFLPLEEISKIVEKHNEDPSKRHAQHILAHEVVALIYGTKEATNVQNRHKGLFSKPGGNQISSYPTDGPVSANMASGFQIDLKLPESLILGKSLSRILYAAGLADSVTDGNRLTQHQGAYIGGSPGQPSATNKGMSYGELTYTPIKNWFPQDTKNFLIDGELLILRRGKHFVRVVKMVSNKEWEESGAMYPGEPGTGRVRLLRDTLRKAAEDKDLSVNDPDTREKLLDGATNLYQDRAGLLEDFLPESLQVDSNRARQILRESLMYIPTSGGATSTKVKTAAIDEVLERARQEIGHRNEEARKSQKQKQPKKAPSSAPPKQEGLVTRHFVE